MHRDVEQESEFEKAVTDRFSVSFSTDVDITRERRFDLLRSDRGILSDQEVSLSAAGFYRPGPASNWQVFGEFSLVDDARREDAVSTNSNSGIFIESLAIQGQLPGSQAKWILGRHNINDQREWLFDSGLDGASLSLPIAGGEALVSIGREQFFRTELAGRRDPDSPFLGFIRYQWQSASKRRHSLYLLGLDGRSRLGNEDLRYIGATSTGDLTNTLSYDFQFAFMAGRDQGERTSGVGLDAGLTKIWQQARWRPTIYGRFAFGTGGSGDSPENGFRQTGLQDNAARLGSDTSIKYYGVAFDPELSNLLVATAGIGIQPIQSFSVDLVYHIYQQHRAADSLRDSAITASPDGINRALGHEFDLVLAYKPSNRVGLELTFGQFHPGAAFGLRQETASFAELAIALKF